MKINNTFASFSVSDVEKAKAFYGGKLGLQGDVNEMGILDLSLPGGIRASLYPKPDHQPATYTVLNFIVPNVESAVDELAGKGIAMERYDMEWLKTNEKGIAGGTNGEPRIAWFKDPFGNILSVIETPG